MARVNQLHGWPTDPPDLLTVTAADIVGAPVASAWVDARRRRLAYGAQLQARLAGDPAARTRLQAAWQPLVDYLEAERRRVDRD